MTSLHTHQMAAIKGIAAYLESDDPVIRTPALRDVARVYVGAREHFFTQEGEPDWTGRTHAYRQFVAETMTLAGVPAELRNTVRSAIAYHLSAALRERISPDEAEDLGLTPESARERSAKSRGKAQTLTHLFGGGGAISDPDDVVVMYRLIRNAARRVTREAIAEMTPAQRAELESVREATRLAMDRLLHAEV